MSRQQPLREFDVRGATNATEMTDIQDDHAKKSESSGSVLAIAVIAVLLTVSLLLAFGIIPTAHIGFATPPDPDGSDPATNATTPTPTPTIQIKGVPTFALETATPNLTPTVTPIATKTEGPSPKPLISSTEQTRSPPPPI